MNRRRFLRDGMACGALALGGTGFLFIRRSQARSHLATQMVNDALPALTTSALNQLSAFPARARDEIRRYFHGRCLNVQGFVSHISSREFETRLASCQTDKAKHECFLLAFCERVASDSQILNQVRLIAESLGSELEFAWSAYCRELSGKWNARIGNYGSGLDADQLTERADGMIRSDLQQALNLAKAANERPALGDTIGKIGASAILLLPLVELGPVGLQVGIPVFVLLAAKYVWDYAIGQLATRPAGYQEAISAQLALLGNRVGAEFENEFKRRLGDLHEWQERSIVETANRLAEERVGLLYREPT